VVLAKIDATEEPEIANKYHVRGYPSLKMFRGDPNAPVDYEGPRESAGIVQFLKKQVGPAVRMNERKLHLDDIYDGHHAALIASAPEGSPEFVVLKGVAEHFRGDIPFHVFTSSGDFPAEVCEHSPKVCEAKGVEVVVVKKYDDAIMVYPDNPENASDLQSWIRKVLKPSITMLSRDSMYKKTLELYFARNSLKVLVIDTSESWADENNSVRAAVHEIQNAYTVEHEAGELDVIGVDATENAAALDFFGVTKDDLPAIVAHDVKKDNKYVHKGISLKDGRAVAWVEGVIKGEVEKHTKSEPKPETNDGPVKVIVGTTFDELVLDSNKLVLIEFYAPWCGHCKRLEPIYKEVGEAFADDDSIVIAKMDATANDIPGDKFKVSGFPTLYLYDGKTGEVKSYKGDRSKDDLITFIKSHGEAAAHDEL